ncbi:MAG: WG repeat-containing protein [Coriobacteriia bacterium]|nr:WG repeat-containing protein [Coriobacteriia bacterium]MCL2749708.1 WG repeat-containing protein [Coriobacteriia bacterium]
MKKLKESRKGRLAILCLLVTVLLIASLPLTSCNEVREEPALLGYIDESGEWVIEPRFTRAEPFSDNGLAMASEISGRLDFGIINVSGEWVIEPGGGNNLLAPPRFSSGLIAMRAYEAPSTFLWGYVDETGSWVIEPQFKEVGNFAENGLAMAKEGEVGPNGETRGYGFIDVTGNWVIEPTFSFCGTFKPNGLALARAFDSGGLYGYIDETGSWVIEPQFSNTSGFDSSANGIIAVEDPETKLWGIIDETGSWVIEPRFKGAVHFAENGLARLIDEETRLFGYIDTTCSWVIEPQFQGARNFVTFNDGTSLAPVKENNRWGCIDETGEWVIQPTFGEIYPFGENGLAFACKRNSDRYGYIDRNGEWVIKPQFSNDRTNRSDDFNFSNGLAVARPY